MKKYFYVRIASSLLAVVIICSILSGCRKIDEDSLKNDSIQSTENIADDSTLSTEKITDDIDGSTDSLVYENETKPQNDTTYDTDKEHESNVAETKPIKDTVQAETSTSSKDTADAPPLPQVPDDEEDRYKDIPEKYKNHPMLAYKNSGACKELRGNILITFVFLDDCESTWDEVSRNNAKKALSNEISNLKSNATSYGVNLSVYTDYRNSNAKKHNIGDGSASYIWIHGALNAAGLPQLVNLNDDLKALNTDQNINEAPVIFLVNKKGRATAYNEKNENNSEYALIFNEYSSFRHELYHLYGASDFYYPKEVRDAAEKYLPDSVMRSGENLKVDSLTAFTLGWTDNLNTDAISFLDATCKLTMEYIEETRGNNQLTGNGTIDLSGDTYTGDLLVGVPHGYGKMFYSNGVSCEGNWEHGIPTGELTVTYSDGSVYKGYLKDWKKDGSGTITYSNGETYVGDFSNDVRQGQGKIVYPSGSVYEGDWYNDKQHGKGTYTRSDGSAYTGEFTNGQITGTGTETYSNGDSYTGDFLNSDRHGKGTYKFASGATYIGSFENGVRSGYGEYSKPNGDSYKGYWKNNVRHGQGSMFWSSGSSYEGEWSNDKMNGYGTYIWTSGNTYTGFWKDNLMHGEGKFTYANGTVKEGTWEDDEYIG